MFTMRTSPFERTRRLLWVITLSIALPTSLWIVAHNLALLLASGPQREMPVYGAKLYL